MRRLLMSLSVVSLLAACGGGSDGTTNPPATPSITLSASSSAGTIARGASATTALTIARVNAFTGAVSMSADGQPAGVTVQFAPQSLANGVTSSTATISVDQTAAPGTSTITIRANGVGVSEKTVTYAVTVPTPAITLTAGAATVSVVAGGTATVPITITRSNGATGAITLAATGLPTGTTATFAPATIGATETTSTMTLAVGATTAAGTSPITITASATGVTAQTATVQLTVTAAATPAIAISAAPAALAVTAGATGTSTLTIAKTGGFAGNVALSLTGAPAGVTATFTPNPATGTTASLSLATTAAVVPGAYNLTVRGTGTGVTDATAAITLTVNAAPAVTVTLAPTTLSIAQNSTGQTAVTLARLGGLTGDIAMTATGAPAGMTISFAPATVTATSSTLLVTVGSAVATGSYPITVTGTGVGSVVGTATLTVTVTTAQGFGLAATGATAQQGGTGTSTVTVTRTGGYAANVELTVTGLPANVTASFNPASVSGTSSTLTFTAAAGAAVGTTTVTVNGTGTGAPAQSAQLTLSITAAGGGGGGAGAIAWRFCDATRVPLWFAFRDGATGTWTRITPTANNTFNFTSNQAVGSVAYVQNNGAGVQGAIQHYASSEIAAQAAAECTGNPGGKTLNGSFAGLGAGQNGNVSVGIATAAVTNFAVPTFTITNVPDQLTDLTAYRSSFVINGANFSIVPDKMVLRRNVNYAAGSTIPVIDFNGAEAFAPGSATITLANAGSDNTTLFTSFLTANGQAGTFAFITGLTAGTTATQYGIPSSKTQAGDFHLSFANATDPAGTTIRSIFQYNRDLAARTLTFGAQLTAPTITTSATAPYARIKAKGTWQSEYGISAASSFTQTVSGGKGWSITATRGFFGNSSTEYELELLDFSGVAGFNNAWGLTTGAAVNISTSAVGAVTGNFGAISEGNSYKLAARIQTTTP